MAKPRTEEKPKFPKIAPDQMLAMMESQAKHAGETMWAVTMREAVAYFRVMVAANKLDKWRPPG